MTNREVSEWRIFYRVEQADEEAERSKADRKAKSPYND